MTIAISLLGFSEENLRFLLEGDKLARELNDNRGIMIFSGIIGIFYTYQGKSIQGMKYVKKAFEEARKLNDLELMARAAFNLCVSS